MDERNEECGQDGDWAGSPEVGWPEEYDPHSSLEGDLIADDDDEDSWLSADEKRTKIAAASAEYETRHEAEREAAERQRQSKLDAIAPRISRTKGWLIVPGLMLASCAWMLWGTKHSTEPDNTLWSCGTVAHALGSGGPTPVHRELWNPSTTRYAEAAWNECHDWSHQQLQEIIVLAVPAGLWLALGARHIETLKRA